MSASKKKKLRKEQETARMTQRQQAEKKEARKLKAYTWTFCVAITLIVCIVAGYLLATPIDNLIERNGTSVIAGGEKISHTEMNYFYIDAINQFKSTYSSYFQYLVDVSTPLDEQKCSLTSDGSTWADYFIELALNNAKNNYALCQAAEKAGYKIPADEAADLDELFGSMDEYAEKLGYDNANKYLQTVYGKSANKKTYQKYYEKTILASSYYSSFAEGLKLSYTPEDLRAYETEKDEDGHDKVAHYNSYSYASFYMSLDKFKFGGTKSEDGKTTTYSPEEIAAAEAYIKAAFEKLADKNNNTVELLNAAIAELEKELAAKRAEENPTTTPSDPSGTTDASEPSEPVSEPSEEPTEPSEEATEPSTEAAEPSEDASEPSADASEPSADASEPSTEPSEPTEDEDDDDDKKEETKYSTATEVDDALYSSISSIMQEWLSSTDRVAGDITCIPYETTTKDEDGKEVKTLKGYYVVLYKETNDNIFALADVRHILIKFEGGKYNSTTGQTTYTDAEKKAAKDKADALLDEWKKGAATEDTFAELANKNTADTGSNTNGGLYEDVYPGQMVTNFNDWCFDEAREVGDTGIVESTYGYHIMYYVGDSDDNYRDYLVRNDLLNEEITEWQEALIEAFDFEVKSTKHIKSDLIIANTTLYG